MEKLPTYNGYTVDMRLQEFRKAERGKYLEFVPFKSKRGQELIKKYQAKERRKHEALNQRSKKKVTTFILNGE